MSAAKSQFLPPLGTIALCVITLIVATLQSVVGVEPVSIAIGLLPDTLRHPNRLFQIADGQWVPGIVSLVTYVFPHGGWWHVLPNTIGLWVFGAIAEPEMKTRRFVGTYLLCGVVGAYTLLLVLPNESRVIAGASLAIAAQVGLFTGQRWSHRSHTRLTNAMVIVLETVIFASVIAWIALRQTPQVPTLTTSIMYHFLPMYLMWLAARIYGAAIRTQASELIR